MMKYATYILSAIAAYASLCACANQSLETHFNDQEEDIADYASAARFVQCEFIQSVDDEGNIHYTKETVDTIAPRITHMEMSTRLTIVSGAGTPLSESGTATVYYAGYVFDSGPEWADFTRINLDGTGLVWLISTPYKTLNVQSSENGPVISGSQSSSGLTMFATNHYATASLSGWSLSDGDYSPVSISMSDKDIVAGLRDGLVGVRAGEVCDILFSGRYGFGKKPLGPIPANSALLYRIWVESVSE